MHDYLVWLIAGLILVITELATGTFFLLFLGIAALLGALVAWFGAPLAVQAVVAALAAMAGVIGVRRYRHNHQQSAMASLDIGQPVTLEAWVNEADGVARVKYRDTLWDAQVAGVAHAAPGEVLYISAVSGSTLTVSRSRASSPTAA